MINEEVEMYKVWPTEVDRNQFKDIIDSGSRKELEARHPIIRKKYHRHPEPRPTMIECYLYYYDQIDQYLDSIESIESAIVKLEKLHLALRNSLQVVTIELEGDDNPQVIFETLNGRGQPLLPSDLLRNYIFMRVSDDEERGGNQEILYRRYWLPFDEPIWRIEEKQGRYKRSRCDIFMQHYLAMKRQQEINIGHLYAEYKYWIKVSSPFESVKSELVDMVYHRNNFRKLIEPEQDTRLGDLSRTLKAFEITTIYPLILKLLELELSVDLYDEIYTDIESYIVRRAVCNLTTKNYNRNFMSILNKLPSENLTREKFREILHDQQGDSSYWPRDDIFLEAWLEEPSYDNMSSAKIQIILKAIEKLKHDPKSTIVEIKSELSVEHILPRKWIEHWPLPNGNVGIPEDKRLELETDHEDAAASRYRDQMKHTFGNLTLLTQPLNSAISNMAFGNKKPEILKYCTLSLNHYFQEDIETWDEVAIKVRSEKLFESAKHIWPYGV